VFCALLCFFTISAAAAELPDELIPGGFAVGIKLKTKGILVAGFTEVESVNGKCSPAKDSGMLPGDIITKADGCEVNCGEDLAEVLDKAGQTVTVEIQREGKSKQLKLEVVTGKSGNKEIGLMFRDSIAGIGTVTYIECDDGDFGALGHPVSDVKSGAMIPISDGMICPASIENVQKGNAGEPGILQGEFKSEVMFGNVCSNTMLGIFGELEDPALCPATKALPVGEKENVHTGKASIIANVCGSDCEEYDIEIIRIYNDDNKSRSIMLKVTDRDLLNITGGIVQGMSGSPIIQDGKLIGAVTHVLVNDPTRGYGVFIENMLEAAA